MFNTRYKFSARSDGYYVRTGYAGGILETVRLPERAPVSIREVERTLTRASSDIGKVELTPLTEVMSQI
jgi:hypothetical protein